jgi:hypothetical protein
MWLLMTISYRPGQQVTLRGPGNSLPITITQPNIVAGKSILHGVDGQIEAASAYFCSRLLQSWKMVPDVNLCATASNRPGYCATQFATVPVLRAINRASQNTEP